MKKDADYWIENLHLKPHPEGGYYCETYRAQEKVNGVYLPSRYRSDRAFSTAIYFLLKGDQVSKLHRLRSDEIWHYYQGSSLTLYIINADGALNVRKLGPGVEGEEDFQVIIPAGCWFGAEVNEKDAYSLIGCTVAPGFEFEDFELGKREELMSDYPRYREIIVKLT